MCQRACLCGLVSSEGPLYIFLRRYMCVCVCVCLGIRCHSLADLPVQWGLVVVSDLGWDGGGGGALSVGTLLSLFVCVGRGDLSTLQGDKETKLISAVNRCLRPQYPQVFSK